MLPKKDSVDKLNKENSKVELVKIINLKNPLIVLSKSINWNYFKEKFCKVYNPIFGRPEINTRLMVALHYLKYAYDLGDRTVLELWIENPYWKYWIC